MPHGCTAIPVTVVSRSSTRSGLVSNCGTHMMQMRTRSAKGQNFPCSISSETHARLENQDIHSGDNEELGSASRIQSTRTAMTNNINLFIALDPFTRHRHRRPYAFCRFVERKTSRVCRWQWVLIEASTRQGPCSLSPPGRR